MNFISHSSAQTEALGARLFSCLPERCVVYLIGELGAGKTTLVRGFFYAAGYIGAVKSPTFTLVEEYVIAERKIFHFDLYRIADPEELEWIGIRDYFSENALTLIEWPDRGAGYLSEADVIIEIKILAAGRELLVRKWPDEENIPTLEL